MKKFKEGDKVHLKGTFVNATIVTNHCNGYFDIKFTDSIVRTDVHISELSESTNKVLKGHVKCILRFRANIELFIVKNIEIIFFYISITLILGLIGLVIVVLKYVL